MMNRLAFLFPLLIAAACTAASSAPEGAVTTNAGGAADARPAPRIGLSNAALAGIYRLRGEPDTVSELALESDGHFQFGFSAGALDLTAQGRWTSDGRSVTLNTEPRPVPPVFSAGPVARSNEAPLVIKVQDPHGRGLALIDVRVGFADGRIVEGYTQDYGWQLTEPGDPGTVRWVELSLNMYGLPPQRFPLDGAAGNEFSFTLTPNDLGVQDFRDAVLPITREGLVLDLLGGSGTYVRQGRGR